MVRFEPELTEISNAIKRITDSIPRQDMTRERLDNLDIARGMAIFLMFLSHTVMALNTYASLPSYAIVPVHTITKFSSTLFFLTFGVSVALFYLPSYGTEKWPARRRRLLWRAVNILLWYKILTIAQMFQTRSDKFITEALLFKRFTDFVEVLNFYWLAILWIVLLIPLWVRMNHIVRFVFFVSLATAGMLLNQHFNFWGIWQLKAMLVEYNGAYCFGQFQRGALALYGMFLAGLFMDGSMSMRKRFFWIGLISLLCAAAASGYFLYLTNESSQMRQDVILAISKNYGKHPPNTYFSAFSFAGASALLALSLWLPKFLAVLFRPFAIIGKEAFFCFNYHILVIFIVFRYLLDLRLKLSYSQTLLCLGLVVVSALLLAPVNTWIKKQHSFWKAILP